MEEEVSNRVMTELRFTVMFLADVRALGTRGETGVGVGVLTRCRGERVGGVMGKGKGREASVGDDSGELCGERTMAMLSSSAWRDGSIDSNGGEE